MELNEGLEEGPKLNCHKTIHNLMNGAAVGEG